jgi:hypothetical protein
MLRFSTNLSKIFDLQQLRNAKWFALLALPQQYAQNLNKGFASSAVL